jgi:hypothetical protein
MKIFTYIKVIVINQSDVESWRERGAARWLPCNNSQTTKYTGLCALPIMFCNSVLRPEKDLSS